LALNLLQLATDILLKRRCFFVATADAGSTPLGKPYEMKCTHDHGNFYVHFIERPDIISKFFLDSNTIDKHNQSRPFNLALKKTWLTQDPYFCLVTTLLRIIIVNTWKLVDCHKILNPPNSREDTKMPIKKFDSGILCYQLVTNTSAFLSYPPQEPRLLSEISMPTYTLITATEVSDVSSNYWQKWKMEHIDTRMQIVQEKGGEETSCGPL
jgi:hypothetical protein